MRKQALPYVLTFLVFVGVFAGVFLVATDAFAVQAHLHRVGSGRLQLAVAFFCGIYFVVACRYTWHWVGGRRLTYAESRQMERLFHSIIGVVLIAMGGMVLFILFQP